MPDPTVTDNEGAVSQNGTGTNPIFAQPARVGDEGFCVITPPDGWEWTAGALTLPAVPYIQMSLDGIDWANTNTSLNIPEVISYPVGRVVNFRITGATTTAPYFVLPVDGLTVAETNTAYGSLSAAAAITGDAIPIQIVTGSLAAAASVLGAALVVGSRLAEGSVGAVVNLAADVAVVPYPIDGTVGAAVGITADVIEVEVVSGSVSAVSAVSGSATAAAASSGFTGTLYAHNDWTLKSTEDTDPTTYPTDSGDANTQYVFVRVGSGDWSAGQYHGTIKTTLTFTRTAGSADNSVSISCGNTAGENVKTFTYTENFAASATVTIYVSIAQDEEGPPYNYILLHEGTSNTRIVVS